MPQLRRMTVFFCLTALLLAAVAPGATGLPLAILFTLCFAVAISTRVPLAIVEEQGQTMRAFALPAFSPRPPPVC